MGLTFLQRMWPGVTDKPLVELLDSGLAVLVSINLDVAKADDAAVYPAPVMDDRMEPERTTLDLADGTLRDVTHGYRFKVDLYYNLTNKYGRNVLVQILDHLKTGMFVKFYPNRGNVKNFHICKLGDSVNVDRHPELYAAGYQCELSLVGVVREPNIGTYKPTYFTDFTNALFAYGVGDTVRDFANVALAYLATDKVGYFSPDTSQGSPWLPPI